MPNGNSSNKSSPPMVNPGLGQNVKYHGKSGTLTKCQVPWKNRDFNKRIHRAQKSSKRLMVSNCRPNPKADKKYFAQQYTVLYQRPFQKKGRENGFLLPDQEEQNRLRLEVASLPPKKRKDSGFLLPTRRRTKAGIKNYFVSEVNIPPTNAGNKNYSDKRKNKKIPPMQKRILFRQTEGPLVPPIQTGKVLGRAD